MTMRVLAGLLFTFVAFNLCSAHATSTEHRFIIWGQDYDGLDHFGRRLSLYVGWTNGFFFGNKNDLQTCLEDVPADQAIAMIDKFYKDHPEKWNFALTEEIINALTVRGGPCEGKKPKSHS